MCGVRVEPPAPPEPAPWVANVASVAAKAMPPNAEVTPVPSAVPMKYQALRTIARVYKACAIVVLGAGILMSLPGLLLFRASFISALERPNPYLGRYGAPELLEMVVGFITSVVPVAIGLILFMLLYAIGESISLGIDLEENTRVICGLLERHLEPREVETAPVCATVITPASQGRA